MSNTVILLINVIRAGLTSLSKNRTYISFTNKLAEDNNALFIVEIAAATTAATTIAPKSGAFVEKNKGIIVSLFSTVNPGTSPGVCATIPINNAPKAINHEFQNGVKSEVFAKVIGEFAE